MTKMRGMFWSVVSTALVLGTMALGTVACGRGDGLRRLPRYVTTSARRDFPSCGRGAVRGRELGGGRYEMIDCGVQVVYACPRHAARWRGCELEQQAQPVYAVVQQPQPQQGVVVVTAGGQAEQPATVLVPPPPQDPSTQTPQQQATEATVRQWLDGNRAAILQCTQTQAALVEVTWTAEGIPSVMLGGEMHGTPGEQCVVQALGSVQFQNTGGAGQVRHVIQ